MCRKLNIIFLLSCFGVLSPLSSFAMESSAKVFKGEPVSNGYGYYLTGFHHIEPDFIEACFAKPEQKILEVGPARGNTLVKLFTDDRSKKYPLNYTGVEINKDYFEKLNEYKKVINNSKRGAIEIAENGDIKEFIKDKVNAYDIIYASSVIHFFDPVDYLAVVRGFHRALKPGGKLFLILSSTEAPGFVTSKNIMLKKHQEGDLWAGFLTDPARVQADMLKVKPYKETFGHSNIFKTEQTRVSMNLLLKNCGFKNISAQEFSDKNTVIYVSGIPKSGTYYLGVIAERGDDEISQKIYEYEKQALTKRAQLQELLKATEEIVHCGNFLKCPKVETDSKFQCCSACKAIKYCSKQCQKDHWSTHKITCKK